MKHFNEVDAVDKMRSSYLALHQKGKKWDLRYIEGTHNRLRKATKVPIVTGLNIKGAQMEMAGTSSAIFVVVLAMMR